MNNKNYYISTYCSLQNGALFVNGKATLEMDRSLPFIVLAKTIYKETGINYPKFFKMDNLSKLAFLTAEFLLEHSALSEKDVQKMGIVLSNKSASLDTDRKHQESISDDKNYYPSPATFVYTLPNIGIGEISIRHQIKGENAFFVFNTFNAKGLFQYAASLLASKKSNHVLCGWVDVDKEEYKSYFYIVSKEGMYPHTEEVINQLYINNEWKP